MSAWRVMPLVVFLVALLGVASGQFEEPKQGGPPVSEGVFQLEKDGRVVVKDGSKASGVDWPAYAFKANLTGFHFNLNQPAKRADSSLDNWTLLFDVDGQFRDGDAVYMCGPVSEVTVDVQEWGNRTLVARVHFQGVSVCR